MSAKANKVTEKLDKIRAYIAKEHLIWKTDLTSQSDMFYYEKLNNSVPSLSLPGMEFYTGGIYAIKSPPNGATINYNYVPSFDWRSRHGANDPLSNYYDGDPDGGGWITGFNECQAGCFVNGTIDCSIPKYECNAPNVWKSTGLCWDFAPVAHIESLINLYLNDHIDINLSEQNIASCAPPSPQITGYHTYKSYEYFQNDGVVDEQTFPFVAEPIPCNIPTPTERIFIDDYIYYDGYNGNGLTEEEVRQNVMQNGPIGISLFYTTWGMQTHARQMVGWDVVEWEDIGDFNGGEIPDDYEFYAPWVGVTYWIYKDSWGSHAGNNGFYYVHHYEEQPPLRVFVVPTDDEDFVYSGLNTFTSEDIVIKDNDNDGYFNWGIGPKPSNCPPCPNERDADDNNSGIGPMDEFGFAKIINTYHSGFETSMNYWKQVDYDDCDWVKFYGESFDYPLSGPNGTPEGSNYLLMAYGHCYGGDNAYIESPPIDLTQYCQIELNFIYHKNSELWGNPDESSLGVDISYDNGQSWENIWSIEDDQGDQWHNQTLYFPSNVNKIRFHGYIMPLYTHHDMAIDDITISPVVENNPISINGDIEWSGEHVVCSNIEIEPNSTLTLMPDCVLKMFTDTKIIVKRTGELVIDDALVTDNNNQLWQGIEVWGNTNQPQSYDYQGNVKIINGGTIENAVCGIQAIKVDDETGNLDQDYTGGMVWADGAVFRNCRVAAQFWPYDHSLGSSFFRDCQFITNNDLLPGTDPEFFIKTSGLSRLTVMGSSFTDSHTVMDFDELTSGIESYDTYLRTYSYIQPCEFTGLYDGIRAYAHNPERTVLIKDGIFTNNMRSVYLATVNDATVTGNMFHPLENEPPLAQEAIYCMYLDYCNGYTVEENSFLPIGGETKGIGLVINNSGPYDNEVYNNDFTNLEYATLAQNNNRANDPDIGLVIKCNDYWENFQDIAVTADEEAKYPGIAKQQGAEGSTEMQAGNLFSLNNNGNDESDYSTFKESPITYFHHDPNISNEPRVKPIYYTDKYIYLNNQYTLFVKDESCKSHLSGGGGGGGGTGRDDLKSNMASNGFKADSTQALLTALVDGGNTEVLQQEVLQTMPQEAYDLYMSLMGKSPYLSDSVLISTIEKEYILPNVLIKDILAANPQSAKSPEVMDKVDEKAIPMTEEQLTEILLGKYIVAAKEKLESQLAYYKQQRSISLKFLKQSYRNDTVDPYAHDSLISLLETENGLREKFELVFAYAAQDNWTGAMALLYDLPNQYSFKPQEQQMYDDYNTLINILHELYQAGTGLEGLTDAQNTTLLQLADNTQNLAGAYARNILIGSDNYPYTEPILLPGDGLKSGSITFDLPVPKDYTPEYVKIYPNPAMSYIVVELNKTNISGAVLTIYDNSGIVIRTIAVPERVQDYVIGLKDIKPGIYILKAEMDGRTLSSKKFSVVN